MAPKKAATKPAPKKVAEKPAAKEEKKDAAPVPVVQKARKVQKKVVKGAHGTRVKKVSVCLIHCCDCLAASVKSSLDIGSINLSLEKERVYQGGKQKKGPHRPNDQPHCPLVR